MLQATLDAALLLASVGLLWKGSDWLIEGASRLGKAAGLSDLTIGLTIVAFGTSAPEFAVTVVAALQGHSNISVGNVVGSNIFNLGFILGGCALFRVLETSREVVFRDGFLLIATAVLLLFFLHDGTLARWEAAILLAGLAAYRTYMRGFFDKVGVGVEEWRYFTHKSAFEGFTRKTMSDADKEQIGRAIDDPEFDLRVNAVGTLHVLRLARVVPEGRGEMSAEAFLRGTPVPAGTVLPDTLGRETRPPDPAAEPAPV